jgi:hypothetical protein
MTLDHLATFAQSAGGKLYRDVCERFGVDPAAGLDDDVLAYQFRVALAVAHQEEPAAGEPDPFKATREAAATVRAMT